MPLANTFQGSNKTLIYPGDDLEQKSLDLEIEAFDSHDRQPQHHPQDKPTQRDGAGNQQNKPEASGSSF